MKLSIVIPFYNEQGNAYNLISEIFKVFNNDYNIQIIGVDDYSSDKTSEELTRAAKEFASQVKIITHTTNKGQSASIYTGVLAASNDLIVTLDGDGQNPPLEILKLLKKSTEINDKNCLFIGHRVNRKDPCKRMVVSKVASNIRSIITNDNCPDSGCGLKLFSKSVFIELPQFNNMHRLMPALFKIYNLETYNVPVKHRCRLNGKSKYTTFSRACGGIFDLIGFVWLKNRLIRKNFNK